jgi:hypothetical protein
MPDSVTVSHAQYSVAFLRGAGLVMDLASCCAIELIKPPNFS